jgi:molybdate transport system ATP-binding protein
MNLILQFHLRRAGYQLEADLTVAGRVVAVVGPSGAGKTTMLKLIAGLAAPGRGRIVLEDEVLVDTRSDICLPPERRRVGCVFQDARLFPHLSVKANLRFGERCVPRSERLFAFSDVVDRLDLGPLLGRSVGDLSGGEARRASLARAVLSSPRLMLLDEPMAGLDASRRSDLWHYIADLTQHYQIPAIIVSHRCRELRRLAQAVLRVAGGQVQHAPAPEACPRRTRRPGDGHGRQTPSALTPDNISRRQILHTAGTTDACKPTA